MIGVRPRPPLGDATVLITGASSGIGRALARELAPRSARLVLVARRADRLEALRHELTASGPSPQVQVHAADLADADAVTRLVDALAVTTPGVDVIVNNAGLGAKALFEDTDPARIERVLAVNVLALVRLTRSLVPSMVARGRGGVLNVGSGAGLALVPGEVVYAASKWFVHGFSEILRAELSGTGVVVTEACPGPVDTEFDEAAGAPNGLPGAPRLAKISAELCAREITEGFARGRPLVFPGRGYRQLMRLQAVAPRSVQRVVAASHGRRVRRHGAPRR